ncbi:MAG TPA: hypothetical protein VID26_06995 [Candidatus Limnocylindrales bacterium]|jgi:hypothetical protein
MKPPGPVGPWIRSPLAGLMIITVALLASIVVVLSASIGNLQNDAGFVRTAPPAVTVPTPDLNPAAAFAAHVDATFNTISAIFTDAEGATLEQFATDSEFAASEEAWIRSQPRLPCLAAAAAQYAAAIASLKMAMDASVEDYRTGNAAAVASLNAKVDPARSTLLIAKEAVDEAAARC